MLVTVWGRMLRKRLVLNSYASAKTGIGDRCTAKTIVKLLPMSFKTTGMSSMTSKTLVPDASTLQQIYRVMFCALAVDGKLKHDLHK